MLLDIIVEGSQISNPFHHHQTLTPCVWRANRLEISLVNRVRISQRLKQISNVLNIKIALVECTIQRVDKLAYNTEQSLLSCFQRSNRKLFVLSSKSLQNFKDIFWHFLVSCRCRHLGFLKTLLRLNRIVCLALLALLVLIISLVWNLIVVSISHLKRGKSQIIIS